VADPETPARPSRQVRRAQKQAEASAHAAARIASAKDRVAKASELAGGSCLVALSGGKDSLVTLDLACAAFGRVEAFYLYLVAGLQTFEAPVDAAARRHGIKVHKLPHFDLPRLIKYAVLRPHVPNAASIKELRWIDVNNAMRQSTGIGWIAAGERASDSIQRRFYTRQKDGVQPEHRRVFPIFDWLDSDVYGYLRVRGIPIPTYGAYTQPRGSGFSLDGAGLSWLKHANPSDYKRVLKVFPYAEAEVIRHERRELERERTLELERERAEEERAEKEQHQRAGEERDIGNAASVGEKQQALPLPKVRVRTRPAKRDQERPLQPAPEAEPAQAPKA
jgi:phosphoadenosine phosphosulfate reductase